MVKVGVITIAVLVVILVVFKISGIIGWPWWIITLPITTSMVLSVACVVMLCVWAYILKDYDNK
jgi:hypothetical protein